MSAAKLRGLPSVERLAQLFAQTADGAAVPHALAVAGAREVIDDARARLLRAEEVDLTPEGLVARVRAAVARRVQTTLTRAVNATGIILHTNLGRAPLSARAQQAVLAAAAGYVTLEIDPATGRRGSRHHHVEPLLKELTGAEAGIAVNNNAAAVLLALAALARGREVVVSRGELVEIGGSFRMPEVMVQSGATLVEVGTTNRTYPADYERAITPQTALLLKVHRSNFTMRGFVQETSVEDLVDLGRRAGIPVMYDLGSGCLVDLRARGLPYEPTAPEAVRAGCDVVTFSGDKLLGGPQSGILVGTSRSLQAIRSHPLARAVRLDKLGSAALAATLRHYLDREDAWEQVPVLRMLGARPDDLRRRAERLQAEVAGLLPAGWRVSVVPTTGEVGGGSLPEAHLPSVALAVTGPTSADRIDARLRNRQPPVFARIEQDAVLLDLRTILPEDEPAVLAALQSVAAAE